MYRISRLFALASLMAGLVPVFAAPEIIVQLGLPTEISCVAASPDGAFAASGTRNGIISLWHLATGKEIRRTIAHVDTVNVINFSPDGLKLVSGSGDHTIKIWDAVSGKLLSTIINDDSVGAICVSPDGKKIYSSLWYGSSRIAEQDMATGKTIKAFDGHTDTVREIKCSADGKTLVSCSFDLTVRLWDAATGNLLKTLSKPMHSVVSASFLPDGKSIISVSTESVIHWDVASGTILHDWSNGSSWGAITPDGADYLTFSYNSYEMTKRDLNSNAVASHRVMKAHKDTINEMVLSVDGTFALSCSKDRTIIYYDLITGTTRRLGREPNIVNGAEASSSGNFLMSVSDDNSLKRWNLRTGALSQTLNQENPYSQYDNYMADRVLSLAVSPDEKFFITGSNSAILTRWDIGKGIATARSVPVNFGITAIKYSPDGKNLMFGSSGGVMMLWNPDAWKQVKKFQAPGAVYDLEWTPDGRQVIAGTLEREVFIQDIKSGSRKLKRHDGSIYAVATAPDGKTFLTGSADTTVKLWDFATGKILKSFQGPRAWVRAVAYSGDGKRYLAGMENGLIILGNIGGAEPDRMLSGHTGFITGLAFLPGGTHALSSSADGTTRIWNLEDGSWVAFTANTKGTEWIIFDDRGYWDASPHGSELVAMADGLTIYEIDQFALRNNRPDLILAKLPGADTQSIEYFYNRYLYRLSRFRVSRESVEGASYDIPRAELLSQDVRNATCAMDIRFTASMEPVTAYAIQVNDVPIFGSQGKPLQLAPGKSASLKESIILANGENKIEISCMDRLGRESYRALTVVRAEKKVKTNLWFLGFGVSAYENAALNLKYPDKDARDLAATFSAMKGAYENVYVKLLVNEDVTLDAIRSAKSFLAKAASDDTFVLFIAGHGVHDTDKNATYYFLTHDTDIKNLSRTAANFDEIEALLQGIGPRNKLFLMDTCESGESEPGLEEAMLSTATGRGYAARTARGLSVIKKEQNALPRGFLFQRDRYIYNNLERRSGAIVFSSCRGGEYSYESDEIGNGFFTSKIIQGLTGGARNENGIVSVDALRTYVAEEVAKMSSDLQHPTVDRDNLYQKFGFPVGGAK